MNLYEKLVEVRKIVPVLEKDTKGYNYSYVSGSSALNKIIPKMNELGLILVPNIIDFVVDNTKKPTVHCKMLMTWLNAENMEEKLEVPFACFGTQDDISKAFGSALTYSERYFLLKFFNISTDADDPDIQQSPKTEPAKTHTPPVKVDKPKAQETGRPQEKCTEPQRKKIFALKNALKISDELLKAELQEKFGTTHTSELTMQDAMIYIRSLEEAIAN